jgi:hypothetical protein
VADGARQVRIFVSSPGDARFERSHLERVIERKLRRLLCPSEVR